jgi:hypothetical protein
MYFLSQAGPLGGLHRASPVPFRASYFTPGEHPPGATAQRLTAYWYRQWRFPLIPSPRFVAHAIVSLLTKATPLDEYLRHADALRVADPNDARLHGWMNLLPNDHHGWLQCNYDAKKSSGEIIVLARDHGA